jgi:hypothetical protein
MSLPALLLLAALAQSTPQPAKSEPATQAPVAVAPKPSDPTLLAPLGFASRRFDFKWDRLIPLGFEVDGLKVNSVFFNTRELKAGFLKEASFGTRAQVEVTNASRHDRIPGFAVAVFDKSGNLLGAASGGTKLGVVKAGASETFDLNFTQVKERLPRGDHFVLSVELR